MTWSTAGAEKCYDSPAHCERYAMLLDDTLEQMEIALRVLPLAKGNLRVFQVQIGSQAKGSIGKAPESRRVVHESVLAKGEVGTEPDS
jgi:hypothetical protein